MILLSHIIYILELWIFALILTILMIDCHFLGFDCIFITLASYFNPKKIANKKKKGNLSIHGMKIFWAHRITYLLIIAYLTKLKSCKFYSFDNNSELLDLYKFNLIRDNIKKRVHTSFQKFSYLECILFITYNFNKKKHK